MPVFPPAPPLAELDLSYGPCILPVWLCRRGVKLSEIGKLHRSTLGTTGFLVFGVARMELPCVSSSCYKSVAILLYPIIFNSLN